MDVRSTAYACLWFRDYWYWWHSCFLHDWHRTRNTCRLRYRARRLRHLSILHDTQHESSYLPRDLIFCHNQHSHSDWLDRWKIFVLPSSLCTEHERRTSRCQESCICDPRTGLERRSDVDSAWSPVSFHIVRLLLAQLAIDDLESCSEQRRMQWQSVGKAGLWSQRPLDSLQQAMVELFTMSETNASPALDVLEARRKLRVAGAGLVGWNRPYLRAVPELRS